MINKKISRLCAQFFNARFAPDVQAAINELYAAHFGLDLREFRPAREYESLQALFTRRLERPRELAAGALISPCDGTLLSFGRSSAQQAMSIKNRHYSINELLFDGDDGADGAEGAGGAGEGADGTGADGEFDYINIYLSPRDYHHYHAPCAMRVLAARYVAARLHPVNLRSLRAHQNLYAINERVVLRCLADWGEFFMVFVGALNVGRMNFSFDESIKTNAHLGSFVRSYSGVQLERGEHLGNFELGSTILLIAKNLPALAPSLGENSPLRFGQQLCE